MILKDNRNASTLLAVMMTILVLAIIAESVFESTNAGTQASYQSSSWAEALNAAESGADSATNALNNLGLGTSGTVPPAGWTVATGTGGLLTYTGTASVPSHSGLGNQKMYYKVTVDNSLVSSGTWWRVRSMGTAELPGLKRVSYDESVLDINGVKNHKSTLRGLSYTVDNTSGYCHLPQVSRAIEVILAPGSSSIFMDALAVETTVQMSGGSFVDSYDSAIPAESTPASNSQASSHTAAWSKQGAIASDENGSNSDLKNSAVYGNASSNGGVFLDDSGVTGSVYSNYSTTFPAVPTPPTINTVYPTQYINLSTPGTISAGSNGAAANYQLHYINISGGGSLHIVNPNPGTTNYINIYLDGGGSPPGNTTLNTSGSGFINIDPGVIVKIYENGPVDISGSAFDNVGGVPSDLMIYGIPPANGSNPQFNVSGSGTFVGVVYAPASQLIISGGASFEGAAVAYSATISGGGGFHYDTSLAGTSAGGSPSFTMASWLEDIRWQ